jgi:hypothetical protein
MRVSIIILSLISTIFATSCSVKYHLRKAISKGYRCDETGDTITISSIDSIPYVLRDSIFWEKVIVQKDTILRYRTSYVPRTRYETKVDYKYKTKVVNAEVQKVKFQNKYITKYKTRWIFVIIAFILGFLLRLSLSETFRSRIKLLFTLMK